MLTATRTTYQLQTLQQAVQGYLALGLLDKSPATRKWYATRLASLVELIPSATLASLQVPDLLAAYAALSQRAYRPAYLHSILRAWKTFLSYTARSEWITQDLSPFLRLPRLPRTGRKGITDPDLEKIYASLLSRGLDWYTTRDFAILKLLETSGARLAGLASLTLTDLDLPGRRVYLTEKFAAQRTAFFTEPAAQAITAWLQIRRLANPQTDALWITRQGYPIHANHIYKIIRTHAQLAGVKIYSPHQWRHRYARLLAQRGMPLGQIAQLMGHSDVSITVRYYGIFAVNELQDQYQKLMDLPLSSQDIGK